MITFRKITDSIFRSTKKPVRDPDLEILSSSAAGCSSVTWKIKNFSRLKGNEKLRSPTFDCCDATWALDMYLTIENEDDDVKYVQLYLREVRSSFEVHDVIWKLGFKDLYGRNQHTVQNQNEFEGNESGWGQKQRTEFKKLLGEKRSELCQDDILTVFCELKACYGAKYNAATHSQEPLHERSAECSSIDNIALSSDFGALLTSERNCDVNLQVGDETFSAHKAILVARSSVFAAMFEHDMKESRSNTVIIDDINPDIFRNVLCYIYTGKVKDFSYNGALELYAAADKYDLKILKEQCVDVILNHLSVENVCEIAILADLYGDEKIMTSIKIFVFENASSVLATGKWNEIIEEKPRLASAILRNMSSEWKTKYSRRDIETDR